MKKASLTTLMLTAVISLLLVACSDKKVTCGAGQTESDGQCVALNWTGISAGGSHTYTGIEEGHTCGIREGRLFCWGANGFGQLGTGDRKPSLAPRQVGESINWTMVSSGGGRTCGIDDGKLYCWGMNSDYSSTDNQTNTPTVGFLGLGDSADTKQSLAKPTQVGQFANWAQISVGNRHTCGVRESGELYCWGRNQNQNALGVGDANDRNKPTREALNYKWTKVVTGQHDHTCAIRTNGTLWCWGQAIQSMFADSDTPVQVGTENDWEEIAITAWDFCGIRESSGGSRTLWCAGNNNHGEQGDGTYTSVSDLTQVGTSGLWKTVDGGTAFFVAIRDGKLYSWGRNHVGELGLGSNTSTFDSCSTTNNDPYKECNEPELVNDDKTWTSVSAGYRHACAIADDKETFCWGNNQFGEVGASSTGNTSIVYKPTQID